MPKEFNFHKQFTEHFPVFLTTWQEFLRYKSISTDPSYNSDCRACANWLLEHVKNIGFSARLLETPTKPLVFAEYLPKQASANKPTVLIYGHYDVQPVDSLELWKSDPFEPILIGKRLYARGAQDNKGQLFFILKALEVLIKNNLLNCPVKLLIEGEEECSSTGLKQTLEQWKDLLQADILMVSDSTAVGPDRPTITMGMRGIIHLEVSLGGIKHDLHSGLNGGLVKNPALEMARLLSSLLDESGKIAVAGYYDAVRDISPDDLEALKIHPFDPKAYALQVGVPALGGEKDLPPLVRNGFRPTIEINGIHSGYGGPGSKTIIPAMAKAKITSRLVAGQDPKECLDLIKKHLFAKAPKGLEISIAEDSIGGAAMLINSRAPLIQTAIKVLKDLFNTDPVLHWSGASIPIIPALAKIAGAESLLVGFGLDEDLIHAPNESFSLDQFEKGFLYMTGILTELGS